jgi:serine/threonine protein kinase
VLNYLNQQFGNYRLMHLIGQGGFAEVYLGEHVYLKSRAAIKVLYMRLSSDDFDAFLKEGQIIAGLQHPHIIRILDFGVQPNPGGTGGGVPFLVMDYAPNGTLRQHHPRGLPLPLASILSYVKQIASALQYAHERKLIHRDIKPENILLGPTGEMLLSDFGIAMIAQTASQQSTRGMVGTVAYMAPEQLQGKPRFASDQYSLGVVVYEWLCGERPFHGSFNEIAAQHVLLAPPPLREKVQELSPAIEEVVLTALAKDPQQRFANVQAFARALEQACQSAPSRVVLPPTEIRPRSQPTPPATPIAANWSSQSARPTEIVAPANPSARSIETVRPTEPITPASRMSLPIEAITSFGAGTPTTLAAMASQTAAGAPHPTREPVVAREPQPPKRGISRRTVVLGLAGLVAASAGIAWFATSHPALGTLLYTYRDHASGVNSVAWSPDGKYIVSGSDDSTVQVWDATTGHSDLPYYSGGGTIHAVAWSPDGKRIASAGDEGKVQVWDATNGKDVYAYSGHVPSAVYAVAWSPDGRRIASGSSDGSIWIWDASTGIPILPYPGHGRHHVSAVAWSLDGQRIASGGYDHTVQIWDPATGDRLYTYSGHTSNALNAVPNVNTVAWSPSDGLRIASGGGDRTVQVWDAMNGGNVYIYRGHSGYVFTLAWSPDGQRIASAGTDTTVQVWQAR